MNNGVYRCGFATSQEAYEAAYDALFARLDVLEERLADRAYLLGDTLREVDVRLFTTLVRFDAVYHGHFKCNRQKLTEFPHLWALRPRALPAPGFGETVDFDQIKRHYYVTHDTDQPDRHRPQGPGPRGLARGPPRPRMTTRRALPGGGAQVQAGAVQREEQRCMPS